jgi:hypothetical protein
MLTPGSVLAVVVSVRRGVILVLDVKVGIHSIDSVGRA